MRYRFVHNETPLERITRLLGLYGLSPLLAVLALAVLLDIPFKPEPGLSVRRLEIVATGARADAAGFRVGDRILAVGGRPVSSMPAYYAALAATRGQVPLAVDVQRDGHRLPLILEPGPPGAARLTRSYSQWAVGLAFLAIGWWVLLRRHDPVARNFFALCLFFAFFLMDIPDRPSLSYMWVKESLRGLLQLLMPAYFLRFFIQFPAPRRTASGGTDRLRWLLIPGWSLFVLTTLGDLTGLGGLLPRLATWLEGISLLYVLGFIIAGLVIFARKIRNRSRPVEHTKMRLILIGIVCGLVPFLVAAVVGNLAPGSALPQWQYLAFSLLLVPASFALAIMRFGALDRDFILRTSLIYGLMTAMLLLIYFLAVVGIGLVFGRLLGVRSNQITLLMVAGCGLLALPLKNFAQQGIDRAFYPARQANRQAMRQLAEDLNSLLDADEAVALLQARLTELYAPSSCTIYLGDQNDTLKANAQEEGPGAEPLPDLAADGILARILGRVRHPLLREEAEDLFLEPDLDAGARALLDARHPQLFVPLVTGNRLLGFVALGDKKGKSLYSQEDLANLQSLAAQAAPLIESLQLYKESLHRKRLEAELEVARKLQMGLLPTGPLHGPGFAVEGRTEPCRMVGGDFYDYFLRPDGTLAVAIGDVSGKGIPAALLMTSLRVAFRSEASGGAGPRDVVTRLNRTVHGLVTPGHFVCFFFGLLHPTDGQFTFCNAGMDPPVLFRGAGGPTEALRRGGPVLGVDPGRAYREGRLVLHAGDRILFYTDGMTDQQNNEGEFFDAERLRMAAAGPAAEPCRDALDRIFCRVQDFGADGESDDMTAIVLQINKFKP